MAALFAMVGCVATVESKFADGSSSVAKVPFGYRFILDDKSKVLESDPRIIDAASKAAVYVAKEVGPEMTKELMKQASEAQKASKEQQ